VSERARRLRIAYVYDALYPHMEGGGERRFHELAHRLSQRHDVHYISWRFWDGSNDDVQQRVRLHGVGPAPALYGSDGRRTVREALGFAARLMPTVLRGRYDVIDCSATPYLPLYGCWAAAWLTETPLVATWHEFWGDHWNEYLPDRPAVARAARLAEARAIRLGDRHVAVSAFTAERMVEAGLRPNRIRVVGNGLPWETFERAPTSTIQSTLVYVGRLIEDKRVDLLIEAVDRLRGEFPDVRCLILGDGPERGALEALSARLDLGPRAWFLGRVTEAEKLSLLKASQVLVLPSVREGFGIAAVEGQAAGLVPVVARSPHSAAPSILHDGVDGLVCDPTVDSLTDALRSLLGDPYRMALMRAAAARSARRWDWDRIALQMEAVYLEAAGPEESAEARLRRLSWG